MALKYHWLGVPFPNGPECNTSYSVLYAGPRAPPIPSSWGTSGPSPFNNPDGPAGAEKLFSSMSVAKPEVGGLEAEDEGGMVPIVERFRRGLAGSA